MEATGLPKGNLGLGPQPGGRSGPHRCLTWASAAGGLLKTPGNLRPAEEASPPQAAHAVPGRRGEYSNPDTKEGAPLGLSFLPSRCSCTRAGARSHCGRRRVYFKSSRVADSPDASLPAPSPFLPRNKASLSASGPWSSENPPVRPPGTTPARASQETHPEPLQASVAARAPVPASARARRKKPPPHQLGRAALQRRADRGGGALDARCPAPPPPPHVPAACRRLGATVSSLLQR